jgi:hypothetical protein
MHAPPASGLAFVADPEARPALEIRVNFGIFAGRIATAAELDRLAEALLELVTSVTIVSEQRHEVGAGVEGAVHQIRIDLGREQLPHTPEQRAALAERLRERAEAWLTACVADRPSVSPGL